MKCGFKTNKILTAIKETNDTVTTSDGRTIHKKLASKPLKFQTPRKPDEQKKAITSCKRCGKFSSVKFCETHRHLDNNNNDAEEGPSTSRALLTMPTKKKYKRIIAYDSSSGESNTADPSSGEDNPDSDREEDPEETDLRAEIGREFERLREQTPAPTTQVGCSTGRASNPPQPDVQGTPIHRQTTPDTGNETAEPGEGTTGEVRAEQNSYLEKSQIKSESEPRRSERIKSARRVVKLGGVENFLYLLRLGDAYTFTTPARFPFTPFPRIKKDKPQQQWFP